MPSITTWRYPEHHGQHSRPELPERDAARFDARCSAASYGGIRTSSLCSPASARSRPHGRVARNPAPARNNLCVPHDSSPCNDGHPGDVVHKYAHNCMVSREGFSWESLLTSYPPGDSPEEGRRPGPAQEGQGSRLPQPGLGRARSRPRVPARRPGIPAADPRGPAKNLELF